MSSGPVRLWRRPSKPAEVVAWSSSAEEGSLALCRAEPVEYCSECGSCPAGCFGNDSIGAPKSFMGFRFVLNHFLQFNRSSNSGLNRIAEFRARDELDQLRCNFGTFVLRDFRAHHFQLDGLATSLQRHDAQR